jgi:hypothetical protein
MLFRMATHNLKIIIFSLVIASLIAFIWFKKTSKEGMLYLDQYEQHDRYRNEPGIWPIPYTATTALYKAKRDEIVNEKAELDRNPACAF